LSATTSSSDSKVRYTIVADAREVESDEVNVEEETISEFRKDILVTSFNSSLLALSLVTRQTNSPRRTISRACKQKKAKKETCDRLSQLHEFLLLKQKQNCSVAGSNRRHQTKLVKVLGLHHNQLDQPSDTNSGFANIYSRLEAPTPSLPVCSTLSEPEFMSDSQSFRSWREDLDEKSRFVRKLGSCEAFHF